MSSRRHAARHQVGQAIRADGQHRRGRPQGPRRVHQGLIAASPRDCPGRRTGTRTARSSKGVRAPPRGLYSMPELARRVVSFVAGAHFQPYMSVPTGPTWGGAGPVSRVSRDSLILTLYHGRDRSARGRTRSVWPACRATMRVIGWTRPTMGAPQHAGWGGTLMYGWK